MMPPERNAASRDLTFSSGNNRLRFRTGSRYNASELDVAVFTTMRQLLNGWKDDPERLAIAAYAYENVLGYRAAGEEILGGSLHENLERVSRALYRRDRKKLRARAEGLVLAVQALCEDAEAWRLHQVRVDVAVIECRELSIDERIARLHEMKDAVA